MNKTQSQDQNTKEINVRTIKMAIFGIAAMLSASVMANGAAFDFADKSRVDLKDGFTVKAGVTTDSVFRGVSISDDDIAFGLGVDYKSDDLWYAGLSIASADDDLGLGVDQLSTALVGIQFDIVGHKSIPAYLQIKHYNFGSTNTDLDFNEVEFGVAAKADIATYGARLAYSSNYFDHLDDNFYGQIYAEYNDVDISTNPYTQDWTAGIQFGATDNDLEDYTDVKVYLSKVYESGKAAGWGVELAYFDTHGAQYVPNSIADDRFTLTGSYVW